MGFTYKNKDGGWGIHDLSWKDFTDFFSGNHEMMDLFHGMACKLMDYESIGEPEEFRKLKEDKV